MQMPKHDFNFKKATQMLNFFARQEGGSINKMKSLKLIWLTDRLHVRKFGRFISNDTYVAMKYGPVASNSKDIAENSDFCDEQERQYGQQFIGHGVNQYSISSLEPVEHTVFSKSDIEALQDIYQSFGSKSPFELSEISHLYPEWKKWESQLKGKATRFPMDDLDFFENPVSEEYDIFKESEEGLWLARAMFTGDED